MTSKVSDTILHASCVAFGPRALLITGASGSGKSALALDLISRGGGLISDDRTILTNREGVLIASAPPTISGQIEARGLGLLRLAPHAPRPVVLVADLDRSASDRLPPRHEITILGVEIELINAAGLPNLAPALHLILTGARDP